MNFLWLNFVGCIFAGVLFAGCATPSSNSDQRTPAQVADLLDLPNPFDDGTPSENTVLTVRDSADAGNEGPVFTNERYTLKISSRMYASPYDKASAAQIGYPQNLGRMYRVDGSLVNGKIKVMSESDYKEIFYDGAFWVGNKVYESLWVSEKDLAKYDGYQSLIKRNVFTQVPVQVKVYVTAYETKPIALLGQVGESDKFVQIGKGENGRILILRINRMINPLERVWWIDVMKLHKEP